jgi:sporulation protein YlmC with PRC-barrel domain
MRTATFIHMTAACAALAVGGIAHAQDRTQGRDRDRIEQPANINQENFERLSRILKMNVQSQENQNLGGIRDIGINPENGRAVFVIINPQGEGASNLKAAPFTALQFPKDSNDAKLNITRARFNDAPPFDESGWGERGGDGKWAEIVFQHYGVTFDRDLFHTNRALLRATELLNTNVRNQEKQELGSIEDLIVDTRRGIVHFALVKPQERAESNQWVVVPFNAFTNVNTQQRVAVLTIDRARLAQAPTFRGMEDLSDNRLDRVYAFYGTQRDRDRTRGDRDPVYGYNPPDRDSAGGWQHRGEYGQMFKLNSIETVQGEVTAVDQFTPMGDMVPGVRLIMRSGNNDDIMVHLGPAWYIDRQYLRFERGDQVRVTGSRVQMDGQRVYMATDVRRGDEVLLLRDREGLPRWDATYRVTDLPRGNSGITPARGANRDDDNDRNPARNRDQDD